MAIKPADLGPIAVQRNIYILIVAAFVLYFVTGSWLFGLLIGLSVVWLVVLETWTGVSQHGVKNELKELLLALLLAVGVWFGAGFLLNTSSPLNAIVSCSMLPHIQRGDLVILSGDRIAAPEIRIDNISGMGNAIVYLNGTKIATVNGSFYAYCVQNQKEEMCKSFVSSPQDYYEMKGAIRIGYEKCEIKTNAGDRMWGPCVSYLEANGARYYENLSNDVIVYQPQRDEIYSRVGDIIHRAFVKLRTSDGKEYILTKGDNNPVFDFQVYDENTRMGNRPVNVNNTKGRILVGVPVLGYFKLFISPAAIPTPDGCDRHYTKWDAN